MKLKMWIYQKLKILIYQFSSYLVRQSLDSIFILILHQIVINLTLAFDALVYLRMDRNIWGLIRSLTGNVRVI